MWGRLGTPLPNTPRIRYMDKILKSTLSRTIPALVKKRVQLIDWCCTRENEDQDCYKVLCPVRKSKGSLFAFKPVF